MWYSSYEWTRFSLAGNILRISILNREPVEIFDISIGRTYENKRARNLNPPSCARTKKRFTDEKRLDSERWLHYLNKDKSHIHHTHTHIFTKSTYRIFFTYFFFTFFCMGSIQKHQFKIIQLQKQIKPLIYKCDQW